MTIRSGRSAPFPRPVIVSGRRLTRWLATAVVATIVGACRGAAPDPPHPAAGERAPVATAAVDSAARVDTAASREVAAPVSAARVDTTVLGMRIVIADTVLTLSNGATRATTSLMEHINSSGEYEHALVDARRGGDGRFYLLILTSGLSRPHAPSGYCGAGEEWNLIWLAADSTLRVRDAQSVLTESCFVSRELDSPTRELTGQPLEIVFADYRNKQTTTARYDRRAPERGIQVTSVPDSIAP